MMPVPGGGFEQCYNAQAVVAAGSLLVIAAQVVQAANDKQQIEPMLKRIEAASAELGKPDTLLADTGYFSDQRATSRFAFVTDKQAQLSFCRFGYTLVPVVAPCISGRLIGAGLV